MRAKYIITVCFLLFWVAVGFIGSWLDQPPAKAQEKGEYQDSVKRAMPEPSVWWSVRVSQAQDDTLKYTKSPSPMVLVLFKLLREYQLHCETNNDIVVTYKWVGMRMIADTTKTREMSLEGFTSWIENNYIKEQ